MIHCIVPRCNWKNSSIERLYDHLNKYHGSLKVYECNSGKCTRKFNVKSSFLRHFKTHFNETPCTGNAESIEQSSTQSSTTEPTNFTTAYAENDPTTSHTPSEPKEINAPSLRLEEDLLYRTELNVLLQKMQHASIDFNLKYLNENTIPRKIVFDIQKDIKSKIIDPFSEAVDVMQSLGLVTEEGRHIFNQMLSAVNEVESEYKYLAKLKELDLYVDPREFVISNELRPGIVHNEQMLDSNPVTGKR